MILRNLDIARDIVKQSRRSKEYWLIYGATKELLHQVNGAVKSAKFV